MTVSADLLRLAFVRETTPGVTPATPAFQVARITSEGLNYNPTTTLSNELNPNRQIADIIVAGGASGGDCGFEVSRNPWFEEMLSAALGNDWDITLPDRLEVGPLLKTYTIEKRFTLDAAAPAYDYHRIIRAGVDAMTLNFSPGAAASGNVTIVGSTYSRDDIEITGATYLPPGTKPIMVGSDVFPIEVTIGGTVHSGWCLSTLVVNFKNNARAIECLGTVGAAEIVLGRFEAEVTAQIYIQQATTELMDAFLLSQEIGFAFSVADSLGNTYAFDFPRIRVATAQQVAGGTNTDVVLAVTLQALVTTTGAAPTVDSCVVITRAPTVPA
jgi:hypothetical protein